MITRPLPYAITSTSREGVDVREGAFSERALAFAFYLVRQQAILQDPPAWPGVLAVYHVEGPSPVLLSSWDWEHGESSQRGAPAWLQARLRARVDRSPKPVLTPSQLSDLETVLGLARRRRSKAQEASWERLQRLARTHREGSALPELEASQDAEEAPGVARFRSLDLD